MSTGRARIMVVEDERIVAADLTDRLKGLGYQVFDRVCSGEDAVEAVRHEKPDLVLMDIKLEGSMDGIEAAGEIRKNYEIPVVYLTAFADQEILERAKVTEPFGYLVKPVESRELHSTIEISLYKASVDQELHQTNTELKEALSDIRQLSGLLPICANCKKIRDDSGYWQLVEDYIRAHSEADFSHGICPECMKTLYPEFEREA